MQSVLLGFFTVGMLSLAAFIVMRRLLTDIVLAIHEATPAFTWQAVQEVLEREGLTDGRIIASALATISGLMLLCAILLAILLARSLTQPIVSLTGKVRTLRPGHWRFDRDVRTGDEVEVLDAVVADMAQRLKKMYERLEAEVRSRTRELRRQYVLDRAILEAIDYGVMTVDEHGAVRQANPGTERLLGCTQDVIVGKSIAEILPLCSGRECRPLSKHPVEQCLRTGKPYRSGVGEHLTAVRADGTMLPVVVAANPLGMARVRNAVVVVQDVSEERRVDEMKSEFISLASHQLRTPLSILRWYLDLFGTGGADVAPAQRPYIAEMQGAVDRMVNLLNALLQVAKLEGEDARATLQRVDCRTIVREAIRDIRPVSEARHIRCVEDVPAHAVYAKTDAALLKVILHNLLMNAVKYNKDGGTVDLRLWTDGARVRIAVRDSGAGIPLAEQARVFQKFFRAENIKRFDTDGNGLGLYMCKLILSGLGGDISFESQEGKGTTFTIEIPAGRGKKRS
ncbi:MAG: two-component system, OmpR family, phosphate regulon sensor histidine kinase PhoR [Candidatus Peregrinibacteria bacterium Gr01-1014_25]|nr:MAG: two-component system, OmpR family, phosphate regulon sensor histidine kinase PhoR [Candidatus Peregrinibacteria bacterium Gr01-1014_25]